MAEEREGPLTPAQTAEDDGAEQSLRPRRLDQYFGQETVKGNLDIAIRRRRDGKSRSTTCSSTARPASVRRRWR